MNEIRWIKSSYTNVNGNCVELSSAMDQVRDSKSPDGPRLTADIAAFLRTVKAGRFDR